MGYGVIAAGKGTGICREGVRRVGGFVRNWGDLLALDAAVGVISEIMDETRPENLHTRRAALTLAAVAIPGMGSPEGPSHPVVHFEIGCRDLAKTRQFFSDLFGWKVEGPASSVPAGSGGIAGHLTSLGHEPHHYTIFYVEVEDIRTYLDKATALGGKVVVPPVKIPTGTFAWFSDPEGNTIGLLQPKR